MLALFGAPPPASNPNPPLPLPLPTCMCWHCLRAAYEHFPLSPFSSGTSTRSAASGIGGRGDDGGGDDDDRLRSECAGGGWVACGGEHRKALACGCCSYGQVRSKIDQKCRM